MKAATHSVVYGEVTRPAFGRWELQQNARVAEAYAGLTHMMVRTPDQNGGEVGKQGHQESVGRSQWGGNGWGTLVTEPANPAVADTMH